MNKSIYALLRFLGCTSTFFCWSANEHQNNKLLFKVVSGMFHPQKTSAVALFTRGNAEI